LEGAGVGALLETELDLPAVAAADDDAVATGLAAATAVLLAGFILGAELRLVEEWERELELTEVVELDLAFACGGTKGFLKVSLGGFAGLA